jgi:trans-aconitate 2-methyltransferase
MPDWSANQYLRFADERTRPCRDLIAQIQLDQVRSIIDLGCGPANSTEVLRGRWPDARIEGLDNSPAMVNTARGRFPELTFTCAAIEDWATNSSDTYDLVFSNAALQWIDDHPRILPQLLGRVNPGGALAFQMPAITDAPAQRLIRDMAHSGNWNFTQPLHDWHSLPIASYYDILAPHVPRLDLWQTEYQHILDGPESIVEWYKGTGLRPFLNALGTDADRDQFLAEYLEAVRKSYPRRSDGKVIFAFRRIFVLATRD